MNQEKTQPSIVSKENIKPFIAEFENKEIFFDIAEIVDNNEYYLGVLREMVGEYLDKIIVVNLKTAFGKNRKGFAAFMHELAAISDGTEKVQMINEKFKGKSLFWTAVELDLHEELLDELLEDLEKASR
ncbi:MAG: hypothetical protein HN846_00855 [Candidatus Pacebacteria bacterium]|jgi:hypothetical protein|nr:hypothetical protein [Candidatus Paceibacterota bacterium]MBT3512091.1 hypothetical protein [Candidatus Paceibacterota bacterium]MBT4004422.1 hypothetical protein [Candidatus Paceibacterota bacterium]MBT4358534.1 hypothetical protein [Candidatus Paceibacterota bacterium]MBT4681331.1 hypothetical protein [Candidatus Paceibacterota bacterium]